jgi:hypothetical protein
VAGQRHPPVTAPASRNTAISAISASSAAPIPAITRNCSRHTNSNSGNNGNRPEGPPCPIVKNGNSGNSGNCPCAPSAAHSGNCRQPATSIHPSSRHPKTTALNLPTPQLAAANSGKTATPATEIQQPSVSPVSATTATARPPTHSDSGKIGNRLPLCGPLPSRIRRRMYSANVLHHSPRLPYPSPTPVALRGLKPSRGQPWDVRRDFNRRPITVHPSRPHLAPSQSDHEKRPKWPIPLNPFPTWPGNPGPPCPRTSATPTRRRKGGGHTTARRLRTTQPGGRLLSERLQPTALAQPLRCVAVFGPTPAARRDVAASVRHINDEGDFRCLAPPRSNHGLMSAPA